MMRTSGPWIGSAILAVAILAGDPGTTRADGLEEILDLGSSTQVAAAESQKRIDKLADQTEALVASYRMVMEQIDSLRVYNAQLEELLDAQDTEIASLERQIEGVTMIERRIMPLMKRMIDALEDFVHNDVPFLMEERKNRVARLKELMIRADVTVAEKYRRLMEAFQIENEYGRTIEDYRGELPIGGHDLTVDFLKVGRVALVYQSLDAELIGYWDKAERAWKPLPGSYRSSIRQGLRIAKKQIAPDLITMPVSAPEDAR